MRTTPRSTKIIGGIFKALQAGVIFNKGKLIARFTSGGYSYALATRYADYLIASNTDCNHWSRWTKIGDSSYYYTPTQRAMIARTIPTQGAN